MEEKDSDKNLEGKGHRDKNLEIYFEIEVPNVMDNPRDMKTYDHIMTVLKFKSSNYKLSNAEKTRASLRPDYLVLDDKVLYLKTNESAYSENYKNILKVNYFMNNHPSKL